MSLIFNITYNIDNITNYESGLKVVHDSHPRIIILYLDGIKLVTDTLSVTGLCCYIGDTVTAIDKICQQKLGK